MKSKMVVASLVLPIRKIRKRWKVLFGIKAKKIAAGLWSPYGGKRKGRESMPKCALRETREECKLRGRLQNLKKVAVICGYFKVGKTYIKEWEVHTFILRKPRGRPKATKEMARPTWFPFTQLPLDRMLAGDREWVPRVLQGETGKVRVFYSGGSTAKFDGFGFEPCSFE